MDSPVILKEHGLIREEMRGTAMKTVTIANWSNLLPKFEDSIRSRGRITEATPILLSIGREI
jgi:hypothetical protein